MTATFNYQGKQITVQFDPISSQVSVSTEDSVIKYIDVTEAMFGMDDFKSLVGRLIENLEITPKYS